MKTLLLSAAAALTLSGAALANQYDGSVSPAEFAALHFAQDHEQGDGPRGVYDVTGDDVVVSTSNSDTAAFALAHFAQSHEQGDGARYVPGDSPASTLVSTKGSSLAAFAAEKLSNGPEDDR